MKIIWPNNVHKIKVWKSENKQARLESGKINIDSGKKYKSRKMDARRKKNTIYQSDKQIDLYGQNAGELRVKTYETISIPKRKIIKRICSFMICILTLSSYFFFGFLYHQM